MSKSFTADKVRLDKWLWAARFFKTRGLAKKAIDGGKVRLADQRVRASKEVSVGEIVTIRQGLAEKTVRVDALNDQRRGAKEAALLYQETEVSIAKREQLLAERKAGLAGFTPGDHKPSKKERRQLEKFREANRGTKGQS